MPISTRLDRLGETQDFGKLKAKTFNAVFQWFRSKLGLQPKKGPQQVSAASDILRRVRLVGNDTAGLESEIIDFVESNKVTRAVQRNFRTVAVKQPFNHVLVVGERDYDNAWKQNLELALASRLYDFEGGFEVSILNRPNGARAAYCGTGVFSPPVTGRRVGVLEFTGVDPQANRDVPVCEPLLQGLEDRARAHAGWYEHQQGLVCAFNPDIAPALLDLNAMGFSHEAREIVRDCSFFLGRYDNLGQAEFLVHRHGDNGEVRNVPAVIDGKGENWAQKVGHWQTVIFDGAPRLWVRFRTFGGVGGGFVADGSDDVVDNVDGMVKVVVRGLVVPKIDLAGGLLSPTSPSRWWVEFSSDGRLAHNPLSQRTYAASGASMDRFAVYARDVDDWRGLSDSPKGHMETELTDGRRVGTRTIRDLVQLHGRKQARHLHALLGAELKLLYYTRPDRPLGHFYIPGGGIVSRFDPLPVQKTSAGGVDVSLDWLNRAGGVETRNSFVGLAHYWLSNTVLEAGFKEGVLHVTFAGEPTGWRRKRPEARTQIAAGSRGFLGPMWVEIVAPTQSLDGIENDD